MAAGYVAAGTNHFWHTAMYVSIMPPYLPMHTLLVQISGAIEILLGLLLIPHATRRLAAIGIVFLLIAVFPANVQMTIDYAREHNPYLWLTILRLPLQFVLIWIADRYWRRRNVNRETGIVNK